MRNNYQSSDKIPPPHLRARVHGASDAQSFEELGRLLAATVFGCLRRSDTFGEDWRVLDLGVGCGRVMRPLQELCVASLPQGRTEWFGSDIDPEAIEWCRSYLGGEFLVNEINPPLPFEDQFFDFVYAISLFTHLPEEMQFAWLAEIRRIVKVGGLTLISTNSFGKPRKRKEENQIRRGFHYMVGKGTDQLPKFYQTAVHTREYIYSRWSKYFTVVDFEEKGIANNQDLILCKRVSVTAA
jgi:SAM-dependent methyltransferase